MNELTIHEQKDLKSYEDTIERGLRTFIDVGNALIAIRDGRLYRQNYSTFEEYCLRRWNISRPHAYRLIDAAQVVDNLSPIGDTPQIESHVRPLTSLTPEQQREAWQEAVETAPNGRITAQHVKDVVDRRNGNGRSSLAAYERGYQREVEAEREHECISCREFYPEYELIEEPDGVWFCEACLADIQATKDKLQPANKPHVGHNTGKQEWYTPPEIIEAARAVMGGIDLDPASCAAANETVQAARYYSKADDGLAQRWQGSVWMNPPYARFVVDRFAEKLVESVEALDVTQACVLVNNATETVWFQSMFEIADAVCFIKGRLQFIDENGDQTGGPLQGQAVLYFGPAVVDFAVVFDAFGIIVEPVR